MSRRMFAGFKQTILVIVKKKKNTMMPPMSRAQKLEEESLKECDCEPWFLGAISENTNLTLDQVEEEMSSQVPQLTQEGWGT